MLIRIVLRLMKYKSTNLNISIKHLMIVLRSNHLLLICIFKRHITIRHHDYIIFEKMNLFIAYLFNE